MGQENQVAVFIDYDNIEISVEEAFGKAADVDWSRIFQAATQLGRVVMRRAYADWAESAAKQRLLLGMGVLPNWFTACARTESLWSALVSAARARNILSTPAINLFITINGRV